MVARSSEAQPNMALYNLRDAAGESQQEVAEALNALAAAAGKRAGVTANQVSRWERGTVRPQPMSRRLLAEHFGVSLDELGLTRQRAPRHDDLSRVAGPAGDSGSSAAATPGGVLALTVAIAVVVNGPEVLVVRRRSDDPNGITWQFPAGMVKPGTAPATVAVSETLAETGVHCAVRRSLGSRVHPVTRVHCEYVLCDYLAGVVENRDPDENLTVLWVRIDEIVRFIPTDRMFAPARRASEAAR
jgi:8-oxo-dGTP pyrophosphatase MutT (NUDIX family)/transcriptional regulator with XRE-family HTH domain